MEPTLHINASFNNSMGLIRTRECVSAMKKFLATAYVDPKGHTDIRLVQEKRTFIVRGYVCTELCISARAEVNGLSIAGTTVMQRKNEEPAKLRERFMTEVLKTFRGRYSPCVSD